MATYYTSKYSVSEIDAAIKKIYDGGVPVEELGEIILTMQAQIEDLTIRVEALEAKQE